MAIFSFDSAIERTATGYRSVVENKLEGTVVFLHGPLIPQVVPIFRDFIEAEKAANNLPRLVVIVHTSGGTAEAVERLVDIMRHHYEEVDFVVPRVAMSAGTILCMSGDKIYMDYSAALGPIDPQVPGPDGALIPALGLLDKVAELIERSRENLAPAEVALLQEVDLSQLRAYENAKELTNDLLKSWLAKYKFKNWTAHQTDTSKMGQVVTPAEKEIRAQEIATALADNNRWKSHGRFISMSSLRELRLRIEDFGEDPELSGAIRGYHDILLELAETRLQTPFLLHGRVWSGPGGP